jgi:hypothetical protein
MISTEPKDGKSDANAGIKRHRSNNAAILLKPGLEARLFAYALAAGAAATLTSAANAEIVYTQVYRSVHGIDGHNSSIYIDLDNDGVRDFLLNEYLSTSGGNGEIGAYPLTPSNKIVATIVHCGGGCHFAGTAAMESGSMIGTGARFLASANRMASSYECHQAGPWAHKIGRYLGLEFHENGKPLFGWARINVGPCGMALTGYAYETVPGKSILAGQTQEGDGLFKNNSDTNSDGRSPATLGLLAQGASGLAAWRRREEDLSFLSPPQRK